MLCSNLKIYLTQCEGWPLITNYSCPPDTTPATCSRSENMGWRYLYITSGLLCLVMAVIRVFLLKIEESPKWFVANGKFEEGSAALNRIARLNKSDFTISANQFQNINGEEGKKRSFDFSHVKGLFSTKERARSTGGIFFLWMGIGVASVSFAPEWASTTDKLQVSGLHCLPCLLPCRSRC